MVLQYVSMQVRSSAVKERSVLALSNSRLLAGLTSFESKIDLYAIKKISFANIYFLEKLRIVM